MQTVFKPREEYKLFTVPEWSQMAHLITDYRWFYWYTERLEAKLKLMEMSIQNLESQNEYLQEALRRRETSIEMMSGLLDSEQKARQEDASSRRLELWLWRSGAILGVVAAGVFGGMYAAGRAR